MGDESAGDWAAGLSSVIRWWEVGSVARKLIDLLARPRPVGATSRKRRRSCSRLPPLSLLGRPGEMASIAVRARLLGVAFIGGDRDADRRGRRIVAFEQHGQLDRAVQRDRLREAETPSCDPADSVGVDQPVAGYRRPRQKRSPCPGCALKRSGLPSALRSAR